MKNTFYEFYKLSKKRINEIWDNGLLIVDTNVLLDLYRLSPDSRKDLMKSIDHFKDRVWIPYQVGLEFHRNRESVIKDLGGIKYQEFKSLLNDKVVSQVKESFKDYRRHPCIDYKFIENELELFKKRIEKKLLLWERAYPFKIDKDDILAWVTEKYNGKTGQDYSKEELLSLFKEGAVRYKAQVPPGYKDNTSEKKEVGERYLYGDLLIWKSVIQKAKGDSIDVIFVTNDNKEDWYEIAKGKTKGPRFELLREFHAETGKDIIIISEASLLKEIKAKTSIKVKDSSIEDAKMAIKTDNSYDSFLNKFHLSRPLTAIDFLEHKPSLLKTTQELISGYESDAFLKSLGYVNPSDYSLFPDLSNHINKYSLLEGGVDNFLNKNDDK